MTDHIFSAPHITLREKACMSYWFPKLLATGVLVPRTEIVTTNVDLWKMLVPSEESAPDGLDAFVDDMVAAVARIGTTPIFLRTGHLSGKHDWTRTCHVPETNDPFRTTLLHHICALVEWSELVDLMGLPTRVWAVRELLPLLSPFTAYNGMPVAREFRLFIEGGRVHCVHPYWPEKAVEDGEPSVDDWRELHAQCSKLDGDEAYALTSAAIVVAKAFADDGAWSLDFAQHKDGTWYAIDMAPAAISFHWEGCADERKWRG